MTIRDISTLNQNATLARIVRPIAFVRLDFASGVRRLHTEIGPRTASHPVFGSEVYEGIGDFGGILEDASQSVGNDEDAFQIALSGVNAILMSVALNSADYYRRDIEIMFGFDDENGDLIDDPVVLDSLLMDKMDITLSDAKADVALSNVSRASLLQGSSDLRFTDEQLQQDQPGDVGGEYIFRMADLQLKVGGSNVGASTSRRGFATPG